MRVWTLVLGLLVLLLAAQRAAAQDDRKSAHYKEAIRKALQEYEVGNWEEAKLFFSDAHRMFPNARTLRGLALTTYALRDYVSASEYFEQAIDSRLRPLSEDQRRGATELLEQARRFVAHVELSMQPCSAEVQIDGRPVVRGPGGKALLNPGSHELVASAPGHETVTRRFNVEAGARVKLEFTLPSQAHAAGPGSAEPADTLPAPTSTAPVDRSFAPAPEPATSSSAVPWILVGVSGAVAITGGVLLGMTASDIGSVEDARKGTYWAQVEDAYDRTPTLSTAGFVMLGVGVAGVVAGLTWQFWPSDDTSEVALHLTPRSAAISGKF